MPDRILVVNQNWMGDVLFSTPAIRAVRKTFAKAHMTCLVPHRCREVLERNPHLDRVIGYDERATPLSMRFFNLFMEIRSGGYDTAIFFHRSRSKAWMTFAAGIPQRWGYAHPRGARFLTREVPMPDESHLHKVDYFLRLAAGLGIQADGRGLDFVPDPAAEARLSGKLNALGVHAREPYLVVHAGGNWLLKRWPEELVHRWIALTRKAWGWPVLLCGTRKETELVERIASRFPGGVFSLCGNTTFSELGFLLKGARLVLSNDSGPLHLAVSFGTPCVAVYGPTSAERTGPISNGPLQVLQKDVGCRVPCYFRSCDARVCMEWLTPAEVFEAAEDILKEKRSGAVALQA